MVGEHGHAVTAVHRGGKVFVNGEYWDACSDEELPADAEIEVIGVGEQMRLQVKARAAIPAERSRS